MNRLIIALTIATFAFTGCKGEEKKSETKKPAAEKKKAEGEKPATEAPTDPSREPATEAPEAAPTAPADPSREPATETPEAAPTAPTDPSREPATEAPAGKPVVVLETNHGVIKIELTPEKTPITVENFLQYVNDGFFAGTIIHRVVPGFVIQGGGFTEDFQKKETRAAIENEAAKGIINLRGTISMARTRARESATSQFFISLKDNPMLDYRGETPTGWGYAAFGTVIEGMDVVDEIAAIPTERKGPFPKPEVPVTTVLINKAYVQ